MKNYRIELVYRGVVESHFYAYAKDVNHAKNIGKYKLRKIYGTKKTMHTIVVCACK